MRDSGGTPAQERGCPIGLEQCDYPKLLSAARSILQLGVDLVKGGGGLNPQAFGLKWARG